MAAMMAEARACDKGAGRWDALIVATAAFALLLGMAHQFALGWDEGYTFDRQATLRPWLADWRWKEPANWLRQLDPVTLRRHWRFSREEPDGHGPFYCLLSLTGSSLTSWWLAPPVNPRVAGIALFCVALGVVHRVLLRERGRLAAWVGTLCLLAQPRVQPEVCYALIDGPLLSLTLLAWAGFMTGLHPGARWARLGFGVAMGLAMATKLTGWFVWAAFLACGLLLMISGDRPRARAAAATLGIGGLVAVVVVFAINIGWWPDPIAGITNYFRSNLTRRETIPIATQFFGERYPFSLPWWNTLAWMVLAMPPGVLALAALSFVTLPWRWRDAPAELALASVALLLLALRALPQAPGHDGTRQLLLALGFVAVLAGPGALVLLLGCQRWLGTKRGAVLATTLTAAAVFDAASACARYHPLQLSYYSPVVGGLPGAAKLGMEPTYFWDALTPEVLAWIDANTPPGDWVLFRNNPTSFDYLHAWGRLGTPHRPTADGRPPRWVVMQHRPGIFLPADDWLIAQGEPVFRKELFGVPLISIYPWEQFAAANRQGKRAPAGGGTP